MAIRGIIFFAPFLSLSAQVQLPESLNQLIAQEKTEQVDSTRLRLIKEIIEQGGNFDLNLVATYALRGANLAKKINNIQVEAEHYNILARVHGMRGFLDSSRHYLQLVFPLVEKQPEKLKMIHARALMFSGIIAEQSERFEEAIEFYQKAESLNEESLIGNIKINLGTVYLRLKQYEKSLKYFEEALVLVDGTPPALELMNNLIVVHSTLGNEQKAKMYANKMLSTARDLKNPFQLAYAIDSYITAREDSLIHFKELNDEGYQFVQENKIIDLMPPYLIRYANINEMEGNYNKAIQYIEQALPVTQENDIYKAILFNSYASNLTALGKYQKALEKNEKCIALYKANKLEDVRLLTKEKIHQLNFHLHEKLGNYKKAYFASKAYYAHKDSIDVLEKQEQIAKMDAEFRDLEMENEMAILEKDKQLLAATNQNYKLITFGIGLLTLISLGFLWIVRKRNQEINIKNQQLEKLNYTKDQIFSIIGHDLRKPALSFRGISKKVRFLLHKKDYKTLDAIGEGIERNAFSLIKLTDNLLKWALMQKEVLPYNPTQLKPYSVAQEVISIFETLAEDKNITIINNIPTNLTIHADEAGTQTILRNLIDNSIKFTPSEGGIIQLDAEEKNGMVSLKIKDEGIGISSENLKDIFLLKENKSQKGTRGEKGTGLGLHLIEELVKMNKGLIDVSSQIGKGTEFNVLLPSL